MRDIPRSSGGETALRRGVVQAVSPSRPGGHVRGRVHGVPRSGRLERGGPFHASGRVGPARGAAATSHRRGPQGQPGGGPRPGGRPRPSATGGGGGGPGGRGARAGGRPASPPRWGPSSAPAAPAP